VSNDSIVLDTQAMLILYLGEKGAERVTELLTQVLEGKVKGYMNVVNLTELYYILARKSRKIAEEKQRNLRNFGVKIISVEEKDDDNNNSDGRSSSGSNAANNIILWKEAALLKARYSLSLADAFAAATAKVLSSRLVTGLDTEFEKIDGIKMERIAG
jgi:predicted nucleic acid-binding protein